MSGHSGVFDHVRECLLDDAVPGHLDPGGRLRRRPLDDDLGRDAGFDAVLDDVVEIADRRLRRQFGSVVVVAQHPEHPSHLAQGLPAGLLDVFERLSRTVGLGRDDSSSGSRLDDHHAHPVGDDVVQVACDPGSFIEHGLPRQQLAFGLGPHRTLLERSEPLATFEHDLARHPGRQVDRSDPEDGRHGQILTRRQHTGDRDRRQQEHERTDGGPHSTTVLAAVGDGGVDGEEAEDVEVGRVVRDPEQDRCGDDRHEAPQRRRAAERQTRRLCCDQEQTDQILLRLGAGHLSRGVAEHAQRPDGDREHGVGRERLRVAPSSQPREQRRTGSHRRSRYPPSLRRASTVGTIDRHPRERPCGAPEKRAMIGWRSGIASATLRAWRLRDANIDRMRDGVFDVLVVGAGINGAVSAAALAGRGASVALIDRGDFGSFTSQESSNLVWGGFKYLENYELPLVFGLCRSRNRLMKAYPDNIKEIGFLAALDRTAPYRPWFAALGAARLLDDRPVRHQAAEGVRRGAHQAEEPAIDTTTVRGGIQYQDAYLIDNDSRFVFSFVRSAIEAGAARRQLRRAGLGRTARRSLDRTSARRRQRRRVHHHGADDRQRRRTVRRRDQRPVGPRRPTTASSTRRASTWSCPDSRRRGTTGCWRSSTTRSGCST